MFMLCSCPSLSLGATLAHRLPSALEPLMSLKQSIRLWLRRGIFRGSEMRLSGMRSWALFVLTAWLAIIWKMLIEMDKAYGGDFWRAVFGRDPIRALGPNGLMLLALYAVGAAIWWGVTAGLVAIGKIWIGRCQNVPPTPILKEWLTGGT
jgi:hypothetical protein